MSQRRPHNAFPGRHHVHELLEKRQVVELPDRVLASLNLFWSPCFIEITCTYVHIDTYTYRYIIWEHWGSLNSFNLVHVLIETVLIDFFHSLFPNLS